MKIKTTFSFFFFSFFFFSLFSQTFQSYHLIENSYERVKLSLATPELSFQNVQTEKGLFTKVLLEDFCTSTMVGNPDLPVLVKTLEIPLCQNVIAHIISKDSTIISLADRGVVYPLYPAQPSYSKSDEGPYIFQINDSIYNQDSFYGEPLIRVEKSGVARYINMATFYFSPVRYNPVNQEIIIYTNVTVEITFLGKDIDATERMKKLHYNPMFFSQSQVINPIVRERDPGFSGPIKYLIVSHSSFRGQLDQFIAWKKRKGYLVEVGYTDQAEVGTTTTTISNYIKSFYTNATENDPAPLFVLFVGDVAQIPPFSGNTDNHVTDLYYFTWNDGDYFPDCYYGRFSAQNVAQLTPQVEKTLMYEQYTMPDPTYLDKAVLIAGKDRGIQGDFGYTHGNPVIHYTENEYINSNYGYTAVHSFYNPHPSTSTSVISGLLNDGVGFANYTAHCAETLWGDPRFNTNDVASMTNVNKMGLMVGNCCLSNKFDVSECFGEAVLRKGNNAGAIGYIGASNYTYWNEDYYWAAGLTAIDGNGTVPSYDANNLGVWDRLFHTHNETFGNWCTTNGSLLLAGNAAVQNSNTSLKQYYWEVYHLMGDPSIMTWLTQPSTMTITSDNTLIVGSTSLAVSAVPYAYVALTDTLSNFIAAGFADNSGNITLQFDPLTNVGMYRVAASAQNYQTQFKNITVLQPTGPFVVVDSLPLSANSIPEEGNNIQWDITFSNIGVDPATNLRFVLSESSPYLALNNSQYTYSNLGAGQQQSATAVFSGQILGLVPDQTAVPLTVTVYYDTNRSQVYNFSLTINSPNLIRLNYSISEISGNGDAYVDPGETISLSVINRNNGHAEIANVTASLFSYYQGATISNAQLNLGTISAGSNRTASYTIDIDPLVPDGTLIPLYYRIYSGNRQLLDTFYVLVGKAMEDFESNSFSTFNWSNGTNPWIITNTNTYEGTYSARSKQSLANNRKSELSITWTSTINDSISFYRKVSSETNYDFFYFYINNVLMEALSGEVDWERTSFPVSAGTNTFKFTYAKDQYVAEGSDCAMIDFIKFPLNGTIPESNLPQALLFFTNAQLASGTSTDINSSLFFQLEVQNLGTIGATDAWFEVWSPSPYVSIFNDIDSTNRTITVGTPFSFIPQFSVQLEEFIPDQTVIPFLFTLHYGSGLSDTFSLDIVAHAPVLNFVDYQLIEIDGNGDLLINAGETFELQVTNENIGHALLPETTSSLTIHNPLVTIDNPIQIVPFIDVNDLVTTNYTLYFDPSIPDGTIIACDHLLQRNLYQLLTPITLTVGDASSSIENLDYFSIVNIYPNPTSNFLQLQSSKTMATIKIVDITGKIICHYTNIMEKEFVLSVNNLSDGIYFLEIINVEQEKVFKKFIKQK